MPTELIFCLANDVIQLFQILCAIGLEGPCSQVSPNSCLWIFLHTGVTWELLRTRVRHPGHRTPL